MNSFTPKYIKMASQYLQERLESLETKEKPEKIDLNRLEKKNSALKNFINWILKN